VPRPLTLERSRRFYSEALGFTEIHVDELLPDSPE
jgi:catechol 2,3-dioxygenase-like lactoylglutathione lyase family enzyme